MSRITLFREVNDEFRIIAGILKIYYVNPNFQQILINMFVFSEQNEKRNFSSCLLSSPPNSRNMNCIYCIRICIGHVVFTPRDICEENSEKFRLAKKMHAKKLSSRKMYLAALTHAHDKSVI